MENREDPKLVAARRMRIGLAATAAVVVAAVAWLVSQRSSRAPAELRWVDDAIHQAPQGTIRVKGTLVAGSLKKHEEPCENGFVLEHGGVWLDVRTKQCDLPGNFSERGRTLYAEGILATQAALDATEVGVLSSPER